MLQKIELNRVLLISYLTLGINSGHNLEMHSCLSCYINAVYIIPGQYCEDT